jgi:hypothetical protein
MHKDVFINERYNYSDKDAFLKGFTMTKERFLANFDGECVDFWRRAIQHSDDPRFRLDNSA